MSSTTREPDGGTARQRLGTADCALMGVDQALRRLGAPGFDTQMLAWLSGRLDADRARAALGRLGEYHPVVTSRLVRTGADRRPCWQFRSGADCPLQETDLGSDDPAAVWDRAAELLSTPCDPATADPIRFHLLRRPGAGDVFLMQYNHTLMDNNAAALLLERIHGFSEAGTTPPGAGPVEGRDLVRDYLRRFPRRRRGDAARRTIDLWRAELRDGAALLCPGQPAQAGPVRLRIAARRLGQDEVRALRARVVRACGYPAVSMALLASVFRVLGRLAPAEQRGGGHFIAGIGVDLGMRGDRGPIFGNLTSLVPLSASARHLTDRDGLTRRLSGQLRERLEADCDLGMLQTVAVINRRPRRARLVIDVVAQLGFSLWYAYFGSADATGDQFCGGAVEEVCYTGPTWPPLGLTLIANQSRGRLLLQATYLPDRVAEPRAREFLDGVVADLTC